MSDEVYNVFMDDHWDRQHRKDKEIESLTIADLPPMPDGFMEQWIAINLAFGSDKVVRHFMELESVKEWFAKRSS